MKNFIYVSFFVIAAALVFYLSGNEESGSEIKNEDTEKIFSRTISVAAGGNLELATELGSITIQGTDAPQVVIEATMKGNAEALNDFQISAENTGTTVRINGQRKTSGWPKFWNDFDLQYVIRVPIVFNLQLSTSGGHLKINEIKGSVVAKTSGGHIRLSGIDGDTEIKTSGGHIQLHRIKGKMEAKTSGGNIEIDSANGTLSLSTSGGNIRLSAINGGVDARTSGGHIRTSMMAVTQAVTLRTSGGNIELLIPSNTKADLEAATTGGEVTCELPVMVKGKIRSDKLIGQLNGGGSPIQLKTSGGNITIRK